MEMHTPTAYPFPRTFSPPTNTLLKPVGAISFVRNSKLITLIEVSANLEGLECRRGVCKYSNAPRSNFFA